MPLTVPRSLVALALTVLALASSTAAPAQAQDVRPPATPPAHWGPISINMTEFEYPYPVGYMDLELYGQDVRVAYMDVAPVGTPNGQTVLLLHGGSYYGWYWEKQVDALTRAGFRVVVKDRLGWGKSSKPILPYSLSLHAHNSARLLEHLGVPEAAVVGHSIGGQMATRFALLYPEMVTHMVMVNPVGLTDRRPGRGFRPLDPDDVDPTPDLQAAYERDVRTELERYVEWKPEYLEHLRLRHGVRLSADYPRLAYVRALGGNLRSIDSTVDDWPHISTKAMLLGGEEDGPDFPENARRAVEALPNAELVLLPGVGHNPHEEVPEVVNRELLRFITSDPEEPAGEGTFE